MKQQQNLRKEIKGGGGEEADEREKKKERIFWREPIIKEAFEQTFILLFNFKVVDSFYFFMWDGRTPRCVNPSKRLNV